MIICNVIFRIWCDSCEKTRNLPLEHSFSRNVNFEFISLLKSLVKTTARKGEAERALASHQYGPGSFPDHGNMWVEFVVSSPHCSERFFSGNSYFPLSLLKTQRIQIQIHSGAIPQLVLCLIHWHLKKVTF